MKKFYKLVSSAPVNGGYAVELDGKPVKTPAGTVLCMPAQSLADEIVREWAAQGDEIDPETMPLTQIMTTMQEQVASSRAEMTEKVLAYLDTDLICYRTDHPENMAQAQCKAWDRWIDWFENMHGVKLETTAGLAALKQHEDAHNNVSRAIGDMDDAQFTVLQMVTPLAGSLVLALAFTAGDATPEQVFEAALAEEIFKGELYNEAEHGAAPLEEKKREAMKRDLAAARKFLETIHN